MQLQARTDISGHSLQTGVPAFNLIADELGQVKKLIDRQLRDCCDEVGIRRLIEQFSSSRGKMLRPGLLLLAGALCGPITDNHIRVAAVVEMVHNAALLHDDVIDEGQKRRGRPTVNSLWGNELAVLLGDFLLSNVFKMCVGLESEVTKEITTAAFRTCRGELRQAVQRDNWQLSESEYIDIITEKSATLFSSSCRLGGLLAGAGENELRALADFGLNFGIAFQITDDLLDVIGDESETGKTLGSDADKNKPTLAVIHLLRIVSEEEKKAVISSLSGGRDVCRQKGEGQYDKETVVEMLKSCGSLEYGHSRAKEFAKKAIAALTDLRDGSAKDALIETVRFAGRWVI